MSSWVPEQLRRLVAERSRFCCEYCGIDERATHFGCEVDHIISEKHGGCTTAENLAYACFFCNRYKGTDIATVHPVSNKLIPLFNPRTDRWDDHFTLVAAQIKGKTEIGEATARLLGFNLPERVLERASLKP